MSTAKILLFTRDPHLCQLMKKDGPLYQMDIVCFEKNLEGLTYLCSEQTDACVIEGTPVDLYLLHEIRFIHSTLPILLVSQKMSGEERSKALELGCDQYMMNPLDDKGIFIKLNEMILSASMKMLPDSIRLPGADVITIGNSNISFKKRQLIIGDKKIKLTQKQADLLELLCLNKGALITKDIIAREIWDTEDDVSVSLLVYIHRLRKIFKADPTVEIQNVHGLGYVIVERRLS